MQECVWYWEIQVGDDYLLRFRPKEMIDDLGAGLKHYAEYWRGSPVNGGLPDHLYFDGDTDPSDLGTGSSLPDVFLAGSFLVVSERIKGVLSSHNLGLSIIKPIRLVGIAGRNQYDGDWHIIQIMDQKITIDENQSKILRKTKSADPSSIWFIRQHKLADDRLFAYPEAASGAEIWFDPRIYMSVFVSNALYEALKETSTGLPPMFRCAPTKSI